LGLGFALGQQVSLPSGTLIEREMALTGVPALVFEVGWACVLCLGLLLLFRWTAAGASAWLDVGIVGKLPRNAYAIGLVIAGALLALWLGSLTLIRLAFGQAGQALDTPAIQQVLSILLSSAPMSAEPSGFEQPVEVLPPVLLETATTVLLAGAVLAPVVFMALWAFPLAAWLQRTRNVAVAAASWTLLDAPAQPLRLPRRVPLTPERACIVGVLGGVLYFGVSFLVYRGLYAARDDASLLELLGALSAAPGGSADPQDAWASLVTVWTVGGQLLLSVLVQVGVAAVVGGIVWRLNTIHAIFAAFVAVCVMCAGSLGLSLLYFFRWDDLASLAMLATIIFVGGGVLGLPLVLGTSAIVSFARKRLLPDPL
jgi:hypothetical protein